MTGYRQSGFDPNAYEQPGRPLRPYNWVQWLGVAFGVLALGVYAVYFAGRAGWIPKLIDSPLLGLALLGPTIALINSRREPGTPAGSEQLQRNRRVLLITVAILAAVLGAALVIEFTGA